MRPEANIISIMLAIICSGGFATIITFLLTRKKSRAEILFNSTSAYSTMLNDMKRQIDQQAQQILNLQTKETYYISVIAGYQTRESELMMRVAQLEAKISPNN